MMLESCSEAYPPKPVDTDEDFLNYIHSFMSEAVQRREVAKLSGDSEKERYFNGVIFGVKSIYESYAHIIRGNYL